MRSILTTADHVSSKEDTTENRQGYEKWFSKTKLDSSVSSNLERTFTIPELCLQPISPQTQAVSCTRSLYREMLNSWSSVAQYTRQILLRFIAIIFDQWIGLRVSF